MKLFKFVLVIAVLLVAGCGNDPEKIEIDATELLETVKLLSHDSLEGRKFTERGNLKARMFIEERFKSLG